MVTAGANQAFTNVAVALLDASDRVVLFSPYYFNHLMAIQVKIARPLENARYMQIICADCKYVCPTVS